MTSNKVPGVTAPNSHQPEPTSGDPEEIRADIERTRAELGENIDALAARLDVKARARVAAGNAKVRAQDLAASGKRALQRRTSNLPGQAREVGAKTQRHPATLAVPVAALAAAVGTAVLIGRRRAARRHQRRWLGLR